jgi:hypothetical protein
MKNFTAFQGIIQIIWVFKSITNMLFSKKKLNLNSLIALLRWVEYFIRKKCSSLCLFSFLNVSLEESKKKIHSRHAKFVYVFFSYAGLQSSSSFIVLYGLKNDEIFKLYFEWILMASNDEWALRYFIRKKFYLKVKSQHALIFLLLLMFSNIYSSQVIHQWLNWIRFEWFM